MSSRTLPCPPARTGHCLVHCFSPERTGLYLVHCCPPTRTGHCRPPARTGYCLVHCCSPERTGLYLVHCCHHQGHDPGLRAQPMPCLKTHQQLFTRGNQTPRPRIHSRLLAKWTTVYARKSRDSLTAFSSRRPILQWTARSCSTPETHLTRTVPH